MRHEAAGITTASVSEDDPPRRHRLRRELPARAGRRARRRHRDGADLRAEPGRARSAANGWCRGMLKDKVAGAGEDPAAAAALAPRAAAGLRRGVRRRGRASRTGSLRRRAAAPACARGRSLDVERADFKLEQLAPHLFMNLRVVDEHGRQLGMGRNLAALKAELGAQARSAFQALAGMKLRRCAAQAERRRARPRRRTRAARRGRRARAAARRRRPADATARATAADAPAARYTGLDLRRAAGADGDRNGRPDAGRLSGADRQGERTSRSRSSTSPRSPPRSTAPACAGWSRCRSAMRCSYLEKNIPDLQKMAVAYMPLGTAEELRDADHRRRARPRLPRRAAADRRQRLSAPARRRARPADLIANEVARAAAQVLAEHAVALRKLKDARPPKEVADDVAGAARALVPKRFVAATPWAQLAHLPRYLKAIDAAAGQAARRPGARRASAWPNCARSSSATCACSPSAAARPTRGWTSSAGCSRNCASACSRRSCARRSR